MDGTTIVLGIYVALAIFRAIGENILMYGTKKKETKPKRLDGHYIGFEWCCDNTGKEVNE